MLGIVAGASRVCKSGGLFLSSRERRFLPVSGRTTIRTSTARGLFWEGMIVTDRFVTVAAFANAVEANQSRGLLEEAGLRVMVSGEETSSVLALPAADWAAIKLAVPEESVEEAL